MSQDKHTETDELLSVAKNAFLVAAKKRIDALQSLLADPHPGLFTWCDMFAKNMDALVDLYKPAMPKDSAKREASNVGEPTEDWEGDGYAGVSFYTESGAWVFVAHMPDDRGESKGRATEADWETARLLHGLYKESLDMEDK